MIRQATIELNDPNEYDSTYYTFTANQLEDPQTPLRTYAISKRNTAQYPRHSD
ncbi:MAG: hypothetical protein ACRD8Z_12965 [Nitrososphaeraceae archaeon]